MRIEFATASRRHRIGRAHVRFVLASCEPTQITTNRGEQGWLYLGPDDRGVMLEVLVVVTDEETLLVIHAMPHAFREGE